MGGTPVIHLTGPCQRGLFMCHWGAGASLGRSFHRQTSLVTEDFPPNWWGFLCCYPLLLPSTATLVSWPAALQITASDPKGFEISSPHIYY